jgi:Domain of unknown function (DUF4386)
MTAQKQAHLAGVFYFSVVVTGLFSLMYVGSQLRVPDNAAATLQNIRAHEGLFRASIASLVVNQIATLLLTLSLFKLLEGVNRTIAQLMVAFSVLGIPITLSALGYRLDVLTLISGADYLSALTPAQIVERASLSLNAYSNRILIAETFWGLWLLPLGYLIFKSGFLPKILGVLLMLGCFSYLITVFGDILFVDYDKMLLAKYIMLPASIGEIGTCFWLLIFGAQRKIFS